ncbi:hypothetical protein NECID01_1226 [Nematocida sp. AWRm77]|nr:hypothetical protein NECID01_1226 [Nematocida sp. AWRm77]
MKTHAILLIFAFAFSNALIKSNENSKVCIDAAIHGRSQERHMANPYDPAEMEYPGKITQVPDPCGGFAGQTVYIVGDNGLSLSRCNGCGPGKAPNSVTMYTTPGPSYTKWQLSVLNGKCVMKSDIGAYAARCDTCWKGASYPQSVFNHVTDPKGAPYAQWTITPQGNGQYAIKSDIGTYITRCNRCVPGMSNPDAAFVIDETPKPQSLWKIYQA